MLRYKNSLIFAIFISLGIVHRVSAAQMVATAVMYPATNVQSQSVGTFTFTQDTSTSSVHITGSIRSLPQTQSNMFGFHIHQFGTTDNYCVAAGPHYNPTGVTHGAPWNNTRHVGDLGNMNRTTDPASVDFWDSVIKLTGPYSIIGRALVIHVGTDDYGMNGLNPNSSTTGNAGDRYACGIIGVMSDFNQQGSGSETLKNNFKFFSFFTFFVVVKNIFV